MIDSGDSESGFISDPDSEFDVMTGMTDVEILHVSKVNVLARGRRYGRLWLLKGLRPELRDSNVSRRRLQKEFEIHSRLLDRGVVQTAGFEQIDDLGMCIFEEWIEGKTLAQLLQQGDLSKSERRRILRELIRAVGYIHSQGVVHRDLKPENVMIRDAGGAVVIIDFGLADTDDYAELKQAAGTEGYISPEQRSEGAARPSDDIYSLGVIMRQLCPGYHRIADRCTGPADRRPHDAAALLRALDRHDRRPRLILAVAAAAALIAAASAFAVHYSGVLDRMHRAESEISRVDSYNEARARAYVDGCSRIDSTLRAYEPEILHIIENRGPDFYDRVGDLRRRLQQICDEGFDPDQFPELHEDDKFKLREELQDHYFTAYSSYYMEWQAKFYRDEFMRKFRPRSWGPVSSE